MAIIVKKRTLRVANKMRRLSILFLITVILCPQAIVAEELTSQKEQYSYSVGHRTGKMLRAQDTGDIDMQIFLQGVEDSLYNKPLKLNDAQMRAAMKKHYESMQAEQAKKAADNSAKGKAYREQNAKRKGVVTLDSGLQYEVIRPGEGVPPQSDATVEVHYNGTLIDGTVFDSSRERGKPARFNLSRVVPGFREALSLMKPGAKWKIVIPPELGYGKRGAGKAIGPNETLQFELELISVVESAKPAQQ
jgi:FKBP-type peptidyl-prolyl cis-trans isomerase FklB